MSETVPATEAAPLSLLDLILCQHKERQIPIPLHVVVRLRGLDLWGCKDPPTAAQHSCNSKHGCFVLIGHSDHIAALAFEDWDLAVDPDGDSTRGIVVEDHTQGKRP